jgi:hypothetical protein
MQPYHLIGLHFQAASAICFSFSRAAFSAALRSFAA